MKSLLRILAVFAALTPMALRAGPVSDAIEHVRALGHEAINVLSHVKSMSEADRDKEFRRLLTQGFDIPLIGRFVMGVNWRRASEGERADFGKLFESYVVKVYSRRLTEYNDEKFMVVGGRPDDDKDVIVNSLIERSDGPPVKIDWRVRIGAAAPRIIDVIVEGASMAIAQRSEFASVIQNGNGEVAALLTLLRDKTKGM
jgi:phospholipid transport system substrate-binding protein